MMTLRFGIEIETIGRTREQIARAIQQVVGGTVHVGAPFCYDPWHVTDARGRIWKVVADASLSAVKHLQAEVVSPVLGYEDIAQLQQVVRSVRSAGAKVDRTCGIHYARAVVMRSPRGMAVSNGPDGRDELRIANPVKAP